MQALVYYVQSNNILIAFAFFASFAIGFLISLTALGINREGRKRGYRMGRYSGQSRKIDRELLREYEDDLGTSSPYLQDDQEHHSSKRFVS